MNGWYITGYGLSSFTQIDTLFLPFYEDFKNGNSDSTFDISTNSELKWNIYMPKSNFGCWQPDTNQISRIEDVTIV